MPPKPSGPPENGNAALTGHQDGAKNIGKKLAASKSENYAATATPSTADDRRDRIVRAKHLEIALRYAWDAREKKRRGRPSLMMRVRLRELERLFFSRWGSTLPDDDAGRDDLLVAAHHIAAIYQNPEEHVPEWVREWAPWLCDADCAALVAQVAANPLKWTADKLAWRVRLTDAERTALKITTIGAIDAGKIAREKRRRQRNNEAKAARRRAGGAVERTEYESASAARAKPWEAAGMSRRTWYRKKKAEGGQAPSALPATLVENGTGPGTAEYNTLLSPQLCQQGTAEAGSSIGIGSGHGRFNKPEPAPSSATHRVAAARLKRAPLQASGSGKC